MVERFHLKIGVTRQKDCDMCPFSKLEFHNKNASGSTIYDVGTNVCKIAKLEKRIGHIPSYGEIEGTLHVAGSHWWRIPENCPNKYVNYSALKAASREE